jgi:23S rRNA (pseudouridine1915-N3)-methyltransferase
MIRVSIVAVGDIKESYYRQALAEYTRRLSAFCNLQIVQVQEAGIKDIKSNLRSQARDILQTLDKLGGTQYLLDIGGTAVTSLDIAGQLDNHCVYIIGGSDGVCGSLYKSIPKKISLGGITIPHQLCRVVLLEQIYRGFMIQSGRAYHK